MFLSKHLLPACQPVPAIARANILKRAPALLCALGLLSSTLQAREVGAIILPDSDVTLSAVMENTLKQLEIKEGDSISAGQVLGHLDARLYELEVERRERSLALLQTAAESAQNLLNENIISREEAMQAQIEMELAKIELEAARLRLDETRLTSPIDGIVVEVFKEVGERVRPSEEVFRIINTEVIRAQAFLNWEDSIALRQGQILEVAFPGLPGNPVLSGPIDFIDPAIDPTSGFLRLRVRLDNADQNIRSGQRCRIRLPEIAQP